jgi:hypothetical protein
MIDEDAPYEKVQRSHGQPKSREANWAAGDGEVSDGHAKQDQDREPARSQERHCAERKGGIVNE